MLAAVPFGAAVGLVAAGPKADVLIAWDGQRWTVDGVAGTLQVMLDLDRWLLLLRHAETPARRVRWVALSFGRGGDEHRALRAALYSSPPEATP